ncbi:MAG: hypothetical protein O7E55_02680, partial [Chloroflexi bacterium]|nr:hypothetical protein [Chloroflexota bacterium]
TAHEDGLHNKLAERAPIIRKAAGDTEAYSATFFKLAAEIRADLSRNPFKNFDVAVAAIPADHRDNATQPLKISDELLKAIAKFNKRWLGGSANGIITPSCGTYQITQVPSDEGSLCPTLELVNQRPTYRHTEIRHLRRDGRI